jgi:hypothetical protein
VTAIEYAWVAESPNASAALMVNAKVPPAVGVPVMAPVAELSVRPVGKLPVAV